jgi:hypothetical protein
MAGVLQRLQDGTRFQTWKIIAHGTVQAGTIIATSHDRQNPMSVSNMLKDVAIEFKSPEDWG